MFIDHFAEKAEPLVQLTQKDIPFQFSTDEAQSQQWLKEAVVNCPAIRPLNYKNGAAIVLSVDSSNISIGYVLMQLDELEPYTRYVNCFGSITLTPRRLFSSLVYLHTVNLNYCETYRSPQ